MSHFFPCGSKDVKQFLQKNNFEKLYIISMYQSDPSLGFLVRGSLQK